jgi:hypothetical protein
MAEPEPFDLEDKESIAEMSATEDAPASRYVSKRKAGKWKEKIEDMMKNNVRYFT